MIVYNEIEPYAAKWLGNLSDAGHIAKGSVDARSIRELTADDVRGADQFHTFAGVGVWSYALRLAGWPDDREVWTGSCPCQPFSVAGKSAGFRDERHLWPEWYRLIRECRPATIFGEQVASPDGLAWLDLVLADLEAAGYAVGAADLCAAGVGAPHRRQRLYFVAYANRTGRILERSRGLRADDDASRGNDADRCGATGRVGNAHDARSQRHGRFGGDSLPQGREGAERHSAASGFWSDCEWVECSDGLARPIEPGTFPLAHGPSARVVADGTREETSRSGLLKAYGNALVGPLAATFITAFMESER